MSGTQVQQKLAYSSTINTTITVTLDSTATSGNLLITYVTVDKSATSFTVPTGFTLIHDYVSSQVSIAAAYKFSDGTETAITWTLGGARQYKQAQVLEYSGLDTFDVKAEADSGSSSVTSQSTGTTATTASTSARAFALVGSDSKGSTDTGGAWTNSFTSTYTDPGGLASGAPGLYSAEKDLSSTGTQTTSYSTTGVGDEMAGTIAVFYQSGSSGQTVSPTIVTVTTTVRNATIVSGALTLLPSIVSATATVRNAEVRSVTLILPSLVTASQTVSNVAVSSIITLQPNQVLASALVRNINLIYQQFIQPSSVAATGTVRSPEILSGDFLSPGAVTATAVVYSVNVQSGSVTILPILVSASAIVRNVILDDGSVLPQYFYSNDTMIDYFRDQTGLDSYNFNELAVAYYKQVAASDENQFNELNRAAQEAAGFVGLAPTDWRNFL